MNLGKIKGLDNSICINLHGMGLHPPGIIVWSSRMTIFQEKFDPGSLLSEQKTKCALQKNGQQGRGSRGESRSSPQGVRMLFP
jgi:hypothetical protein